MKINKGLLAGLVAGVAAFAVSSCAYDPYYSGSSYSGSVYSGNYGQGYGYGSSSFSTSVFVSTGNPRWGYDPYAGSYYDFTRRAYYDPYLYGYYPVGYRPRYVYGAPHPGGWTRGRSYCPPPSRIRNHNLTNYSNRPERYRSLNKDWSRNVRVNAPSDNRRDGYRDRDSRQPGFGGSRGSTFPQRQEITPSRGGSFQRGGNDRDRGSFRERDFNPGNSRVTAPQPMAPSLGDGRRGGSPDTRFLQRQAPSRTERSFPQQRVAPQVPQRRIERPAPPQRPQAIPDAGRRGANPPGRGDESRGRGRGIRALGEG